MIHESLPEPTVKLLQEAFGYCLWRSYPTPAIFWLQGEGGTGKTTLINTLIGLFGEKNVSAIPLIEMDGKHRFSTYEMYRKFLNVSSEPDPTTPLKTISLKSFSGQSFQAMEQKGIQAKTEAILYAKLFVDSNESPRIEEKTTALWDRILVIEFDRVFRGREGEIKDFYKLLTTPSNLSGVLNWALEGLKRLRENDFTFTVSDREHFAKTKMQINTDAINAFKQSWLEVGRSFEVPIRDIYGGYELFSVVNGLPSQNGGVVGKRILSDSRISKHRVRIEGLRTYIYRGCRLSRNLVAVYGWYHDRPLRVGEIEDIENSKEEVEVRSCSLQDYCMEYPEPVEEVQKVIGSKMCVFNSEGLIELYEHQLANGGVKHRGPSEIGNNGSSSEEVYFASSSPSSSPFTTTACTVKSLKTIEQADCERCGKKCFLTYEVREGDDIALVCTQCAIELDPSIQGKVEVMKK